MTLSPLVMAAAALALIVAGVVIGLSVARRSRRKPKQGGQSEPGAPEGSADTEYRWRPRAVHKSLDMTD